MLGEENVQEKVFRKIKKQGKKKSESPLRKECVSISFLIFLFFHKNTFCPFLFSFQLLVVNKRFFLFLLLYLLNVLFIYCCPNFFDDNTGNLSADWRLAWKCLGIFSIYFLFHHSVNKKGRKVENILCNDEKMENNLTLIMK